MWVWCLRLPWGVGCCYFFFGVGLCLLLWLFWCVCGVGFAALVAPGVCGVGVASTVAVGGGMLLFFFGVWGVAIVMFVFACVLCVLAATLVKKVCVCECVFGSRSIGSPSWLKVYLPPFGSRSICPRSAQGLLAPVRLKVY